MGYARAIPAPPSRKTLLIWSELPRRICSCAHPVGMSSDSGGKKSNQFLTKHIIFPGRDVFLIFCIFLWQLQKTKNKKKTKKMHISLNYCFFPIPVKDPLICRSLPALRWRLSSKGKTRHNVNHRRWTTGSEASGTVQLLQPLGAITCNPQAPIPAGT